jgi:hypothetical protein
MYVGGGTNHVPAHQAILYGPRPTRRTVVPAPPPVAHHHTTAAPGFYPATYNYYDYYHQPVSTAEHGVPLTGSASFGTPTTVQTAAVGECEAAAAAGRGACSTTSSSSASGDSVRRNTSSTGVQTDDLLVQYSSNKATYRKRPRVPHRGRLAGRNDDHENDLAQLASYEAEQQKKTSSTKVERSEEPLSGVKEQQDTSADTVTAAAAAAVSTADETTSTEE